jgi:cbb3-type cytochrome oxidase maturation protein
MWDHPIGMQSPEGGRNMSVIIGLFTAGLIVSAGFLAAFLWALETGQYDDTETPAQRVLFDDISTNQK